MRENEYQAQLIRTIRAMFPGCLVLKNDPSYIQGIPDLTILHKDMWAVLEVKASETAYVSPNQQYYVDMLNEMSFAAFIFPENEREVMDALQYSFTIGRAARVSQR